ncbi:MAG: hypothetical protein QOJ73_1692 [Streptosporangiaceae bacterium]|jgi:hypothetical protein|nr:hypothetical protein [Streptosporangiaceae bacterium]
MLTDEADGVPTPEAAAALSSFCDEIPAPDPDVVDNARSRLASRYLVSGGDHAGEMPARPMDDVHAINSVIDAARGEAGRRADALDVGAALVMLCNLRLYLDQLETDLLDGAQQVDLSWDVIAAIIGIPAEEAQRRHTALRARGHPV